MKGKHPFVSSAPLFISFEGIDGSGKSTQIKKISQEMDRNRIPHIITREPGGCVFAERLREVLLSEEGASVPSLAQAFGMIGGRIAHVEQVIKPALCSGRWVLCDRFMDSTTVYQGFVGGVPLEDIDRLHCISLKGMVPDLTFVLDLPADAAKARLKGGDQDAYDVKSFNFFKKCVHSFQEVVKQNPLRCVSIDARQETNEVTKTILAHIAHHGLSHTPLDTLASE